MLPAAAGAQSLADVARAEDARRGRLPKPAKVYTNQDLKRDPTAPTACPRLRRRRASSAGQTGAAAGGGSSAPAAPAGSRPGPGGCRARRAGASAHRAGTGANA